MDKVRLYCGLLDCGLLDCGLLDCGLLDCGLLYCGLIADRDRRLDSRSSTFHQLSSAKSSHTRASTQNTNAIQPTAIDTLHLHPTKNLRSAPTLAESWVGGEAEGDR